MRQAGDDTHHDDERNAVADTFVGDLLAEPHHEHRTGDQHDRRPDGEQHAATAQYERRIGQLGVQVGQVSRTLQQQHDDGQVTGPLVDFAAPALALLLQLLEVGNHDPHQLDDDRGRDIGHDTQCEDGRVAEGSSGEDVQQAHQPVALDLLLQGRKRLGVDARNHHKTTEPIYQDQGERKEDPLAQLLDLEYIFDGFD